MASETTNGITIPFTPVRPTATPRAIERDEGVKDRDGCSTVQWVDPTSGNVTLVKNCALCPHANHILHDWIDCERGVIRRGMQLRPNYKRVLGQRVWDA